MHQRGEGHFSFVLGISAGRPYCEVHTFHHRYCCGTVAYPSVPSTQVTSDVYLIKWAEQVHLQEIWCFPVKLSTVNWNHAWNNAWTINRRQEEKVLMSRVFLYFVFLNQTEGVRCF